MGNWRGEHFSLCTLQPKNASYLKVLVQTSSLSKYCKHNTQPNWYCKKPANMITQCLFMIYSRQRWHVVQKFSDRTQNCIVHILAVDTNEKYVIFFPSQRQRILRSISNRAIIIALCTPGPGAHMLKRQGFDLQWVTQEPVHLNQTGLLKSLWEETRACDQNTCCGTQENISGAQEMPLGDCTEDNRLKAVWKDLSILSAVRGHFIRQLRVLEAHSHVFAGVWL